jgi:hypothetical protein
LPVAFFLHSPRADWVMGLIASGAKLGARPSHCGFEKEKGRLCRRPFFFLPLSPAEWVQVLPEARVDRAS